MDFAKNASHSDWYAKSNHEKHNIAEIVKFANNFEDKFVKLVIDENYKTTQERQRKNNENLKKCLQEIKR